MRVDELEAAVRTICEPIFDKPLSEISFGQVLLRAVRDRAALRHAGPAAADPAAEDAAEDRRTRPQLYPELDLWKTAQPILKEWGAERLSGRTLAQQLRRQLPDLSESLRMLPQVIQQFVQQASEGRFRITVEQTGIESLRREIRASARRRDATIVGSVTLLGGVVWLAIGPAWLPGLVLVAAGLAVVALARR